MIKVLNLYAGIGGNRKLWPSDKIEVTAIELNPDIAAIYRGFFPNDNLIIGDAHEYLLNHYEEFNFIWSSPPCPSHSIVRRLPFRKNGEMVTHKPLYPDMTLYQEIIFLMYNFKGNWVIENVRSYYTPLITPQELQRHYFWSNCVFNKKKFEADLVRNGKNHERANSFGFDYDKITNVDKTKVLRNCVSPELGLFLFNECFKNKQLDLNPHIENENNQ